MTPTGPRVPATFEELQAYVLAAAKARRADAKMQVDDVVIIDKGNEDWDASFVVSSPAFASEALAAVPAIRARYRLIAHS